MPFNSISYAVFLPIVFIIYWLSPHKYRWGFLLAASYYFYMSWNLKYVGLILFTTVVSYFAARFMEDKTDKRYKKSVLLISAILCLGGLFFFKYFNFVSNSFCDAVNYFAIKLNPVTLNIVLPVGISFYTFQTLGYIIDVYRGDAEAEHHFGKYAAFVSFFPQLVAGPIERSKNLLPQIKAKHEFSYEQGTYGMKLMVWGFFKKLVIADTISLHIGPLFEIPQNYHGFSFVIAAFLFSFQIYCDFSGYSDIAIGTAKLMGIDLMTNFKSPYFSQSLREFWGRWHISLSTWFKDYVYIPLGGNRVSRRRNVFNLLVTFLASGLWHGANWTFVIWGGIHGIGQIIEKQIGLFKNKSTGVLSVCRVILIFGFCTLAWVFFAANSISDAGYILGHMLEGLSDPLLYFRNGFADLGIGSETILVLLFSIGLLTVYDYYSLTEDCISYLGKKNTIVRTVIYLLMLIAIMCLKASESAEFVYFQF